MIISKMSYQDAMEASGRTFAQFEAGRSTKQDAIDAASSILQNSAYLEAAVTRGHYMSAQELRIFVRAIEVQSRVSTTEIDKLRKPAKWLDLFAENGIIKPTAISNEFRMVKTIGFSEGDVSFISDMTDDLPTQAGAQNEYDGVKIHPVGNSVRVGLIELRDAARDGRDLIGEGIRNQVESIRRFADHIIGYGAPHKGIHGLLNNPRLLSDVQTLPPSVANPPFTEWANKSVTEIYADLYAMKDYGYSKMLETAYPNVFIVAEQALRALTGGIANQVTGMNILDQWLTSQAQSGNGVSRILGSTSFNAAAADGVSNVGLVGDFNGDNVSFYYATPEILPVRNDGLHFHVPIISAVSDVFINRPESITKWEGM